jgi:cold shock CspA family protein
VKAGKVMWVSPKGYGFVTLEDGRKAYAPAHVVSSLGLQEGQDVRVKVEQGVLGEAVFHAEPLDLGQPDGPASDVPGSGLVNDLAEISGQ